MAVWGEGEGGQSVEPLGNPPHLGQRREVDVDVGIRWLRLLDAVYRSGGEDADRDFLGDEGGAGEEVGG